MQHKEIVVAGGGPAGAYCALNLAKKGVYATVIDHTHPREKPCGGAILPKVLKEFPFVDHFRSKSGSLADLSIITPKNREATTNRFEKGFTVSRRIFDEGILNMAIEKGAELIEEEIISVKKKSGQWKIKTNKRILSANTLVGADGVNSIVRCETVGAFSKDNLAVTFGYLATGVRRQRSSCPSRRGLGASGARRCDRPLPPQWPSEPSRWPALLPSAARASPSRTAPERVHAPV